MFAVKAPTVWPSAGWLKTWVAPMRPPPPLMFTVLDGTPVSFWNASEIMRVIVSSISPGGHGTTNSTGRSG